MKPQPECPECEKLSAVAHESNKIGDFLAWLRSKGFVIAGYEHNERHYEELVEVYRYRGDSGINTVLAEYFQIDMNKVEKERRALLDWLRESRNG